ncbi:MAG: GHMP kinase, partial [Acidobacteria bacterium]|nr:GHMP kinase [Acidobacteriota bacterium]
LVVAYTGASRNSGINNWDVTKRYIDGDAAVRSSFDEIARISTRLRGALAARDWDAIAGHIRDEWEARKRLAPGVTTEAIDRLIAGARAAGASAAKVCGAGGGGCLFCFAPPEHIPAVRAALRAGGAQVLDCTVDDAGLRIDVREE